MNKTRNIDLASTTPLATPLDVQKFQNPNTIISFSIFRRYLKDKQEMDHQQIQIDKQRAEFAKTKQGLDYSKLNYHEMKLNMLSNDLKELKECKSSMLPDKNFDQKMFALEQKIALIDVQQQILKR